MRRYHVTVDATTTAGGQILAATSLINISGKRVAQEGDRVYCPACKSEGRIVCVGPRVPEYVPKHVALADDLCKCRCPILPKLVAVQTLRSQLLEGEQASAPVSVPATVANAVFDEAFRVVNHTGQPLSGVPYKIIHPRGAELTGTTDEHGYTQRVFTATAEKLSLQWLSTDPDDDGHDDDDGEDQRC